MLRLMRLAGAVVACCATASGQVEFDPAVSIGGLNGARDVLAIDIDGDLDLDLVVVSQDADTVHVFKNNGDGTFAAPATITGFQNPFAVAAGDLDCDGDLDLCIIDANLNTMTVLRNNGSGTFGSPTSFATASAPRVVRLADLDNDGDLDAVVLTQNGLVSVLLNTGSGSFAPKVDYPLSDTPSALQLGDIDGDGDVDMVVGFPTGMANTIDIRTLKNNGNGTFAPAVGQILAGNCTGLALGDLDADGDLDLVLFHQFQGAQSLAVWRNNGTWTFVSGQRLELGSGGIVVVADLDGDSSLDIVAGTSGSFRAYLNDDSGAFQSQTIVFSGTQTEAIAVGDVDRDGDADVVTANRVSDDVKLYFQSGDAGGPVDAVAVPPIVISGLTHSFAENRGQNSRINDFVSFPSPSQAASVGFNASIREGNQIVVRAEAPAGYRFVIDPPRDPSWGATTGFGLAAYWLESGLTSLGIPVPISAQGTHTFDGLAGIAPTVAERRDRVTCDGRRVQVSRYFNVMQPFAFTALELRFPVTNAPPDQWKTYGSVAGGLFGTETEGEAEALPDLTVMLLQPESSPEVVELPPVVIDTLEHQYFESSQAPGTFFVRDLVVFPSGVGSGSAPAFTRTFGPDDELELRLEASGGRRFRANVLPGAAAQEVVMVMQWIQSFGFVPTAFGPCTIEWIGLSGPAPTTVLNQGRTTVNGITIQVQVKFEFTAAFEFDALVLRFPTNGNPGFEVPRTYPEPGLLAQSLVWGQASGPGMADGIVLEMFAPPPPCPADANGDNVVNGADLSVLLGQFGQSVAPGTGADFNGDGVVNGADLSVLLGQFGAVC